MLSLRYLEVQGFRSFKDKTRIEFPRTGLVLIRGKSGVGKSNLLLALAYALDICHVPATKLKSWFTDKGFQVEVGLETPAGVIVIRRGRENSITYPDGREQISGAKAVGEEIPKIVGMQSEILSAVTYRVQRRPGAFVSKGDAEKREFLGALIPLLSEIEDAVMVSESELKAINNQLDPKLIKRDGFVEQIERLQQNLVDDPFLTEWLETKKGLEEQLLQLAEKIDINTKARAEIDQKLKEALAVVDTDVAILDRKAAVGLIKLELNALVEEDKLKRVEFDKGQKALHGQISKMEQGLWTMKQEVTKEDSLRKQLAVLEGNQCPTCSQAWVKNQDAKAKVLEVLETITKLKLNIEPIENVIAKMKQGLKGWEENPQIKIRSAEIATKEAALISDLAKKRTEALLTVKDVKQNLELESQSTSNERGRLAEAIAQGDRRFKEATLGRDRFKKMIAESEQAIATIDSDMATLKASALMEENIIRMLGKTGFLGSIFDQILVEIETEIAKMLVNMTNARNISIKFKTEVITAKGTAKKTITPVVYIGGHEADLATGPSGGQQSSIELVIDLAVLRVVERRTGRTPGWLLQDEVIIGQGSDTSVNAIEILKEFAEDKMVLVIDHSSEVKEHFQKVIDVRMENGVSYIS